MPARAEITRHHKQHPPPQRARRTDRRLPNDDDLEEELLLGPVGPRFGLWCAQRQVQRTAPRPTRLQTSFATAPTCSVPLGPSGGPWRHAGGCGGVSRPTRSQNFFAPSMRADAMVWTPYDRHAASAQRRWPLRGANERWGVFCAHASGPRCAGLWVRVTAARSTSAVQDTISVGVGCQRGPQGGSGSSGQATDLSSSVVPAPAGARGESLAFLFCAASLTWSRAARV